MAVHHAPLSLTISWRLLRFMSIKLVVLPNHLIICHPIYSFFCLPSFPASGFFPMSQLFASGGQSSGASALASVLPINIQGWFPLGLTGLISLQPKGFSTVLQHHISKALILWHSAFFMVQLSHPYLTTGKTITLTIWTFVGKMVSLLFNMLSRFVIAFLPRTKRLLTSWLQSPSTMILEPKKIKFVTASTSSSLFAMKWWDWMPWS